MRAGHTTMNVSTASVLTTRATIIPVEKRLPWVLAAPLIGWLSLGLWLGIWRVARLVLAG